MSTSITKRLGGLDLISALATGLLVTGLLATGLQAQSTPVEKAAGKGGVVVIPPREISPIPDLLFFKSGRVVEAFDLKIEEGIVRYRYRDHRGLMFKDSVAKVDIRSIEIGRGLSEYLADIERGMTPPEKPAVGVAAQQPVRKTEILSGRFVAQQGKHTRWLFKFDSELNKNYAEAKNATEYGRFFLRSYHHRPNPNGRDHENEVVARGKYFLFAPGTMGNEDWILNLTNATYLERDFAPRETFFSERLPEEVLVVKFSQDGKVLNLKWADQSGWSWTSPVQQTYYRVGKPPIILAENAPVVPKNSAVPPPAAAKGPQRKP